MDPDGVTPVQTDCELLRAGGGGQLFGTHEPVVFHWPRRQYCDPEGEYPALQVYGQTPLLGTVGPLQI